MNFCKHCGAQVQDGYVCNCDGARAERAAAGQPQPVPQQQPMQPQYQQPVQPGQPMQPQYYAPRPPSKFGATVKNTLNEFVGTLLAFIKNPLGAVGERILSLPTSLVLLFLQALFFVVGSCITTRLKTYSYNIYGYYVTPSFTDKLLDMLKVIGSSFGLIILSMGFILGGVYGIALLGKVRGGFKKILSVVSIASLPWTIYFLITSLLVRLLYFATFTYSTTFYSAIAGPLTIFVIVISIVLLYSGIAPMIQNGWLRLLAVVGTYTVALTLHALITNKLYDVIKVSCYFLNYWAKSIFF